MNCCVTALFWVLVKGAIPTRAQQSVSKREGGAESRRGRAGEGRMEEGSVSSIAGEKALQSAERRWDGLGPAAVGARKGYARAAAS